jgi:hypothetical protein
MTTHDATTIAAADTVQAIAGYALWDLAGQVLVSAARCVDVLLDLYSATEDVGLRWSIAERLDDLRGRTLVEVEELRADLEAIVAVAATPSFAVTGLRTVAADLPAAAHTVPTVSPLVAA